jgi:predicted kinase
MAETASQPTLILIAGGPGAGKSSLGRALAAQFATGVLLDKDVVNGTWVDRMLAKLNDGRVDRDSEIYLSELRPLEYSALIATALDNLALGKTVFVVAPFGPELSDSEWVRGLKHAVRDLGGRLRAIWIDIDPDTARAHMIARNEARDAWKLAHWDQFIASAQFSPPRSDLFVLKSSGQSTLADLVNKAIIYLRLK